MRSSGINRIWGKVVLQSRAGTIPHRWASGAPATRPSTPAKPHTYYVLQYTYDAASMEDLVAKRAPFREEHLTHAGKWAASGELALAGAFGDSPYGGLLVFRK